MKKSFLTAFCSLAVFTAVTSCNKNETYSPLEDSSSYVGEANVTKSTLVTIEGTDYNEPIDHAQVFAYDPYGKLVAYSSWSTGVVVNVVMPCSTLTIYYVANVPMINVATVQTETDFLALTVKLASCNSKEKGQPYFGKLTKTITQSEQIPIDLYHYTAKVTITNVKKAFNNLNDTRVFHLRRVYLANAATSVKITREADPESEHLYTTSYSYISSILDSYLVKNVANLDDMQNGVSKELKAELFTFPTEECSVIFDCIIGDEHRYYTINLPENLKSNQLVEISNVTFTKQGAETPGGELLNDAVISFSLTLKNWEKDTSISWNETVSF